MDHSEKPLSPTGNPHALANTSPCCADMEQLWLRLTSLSGQTFRTTKGLEFTYHIRGGEMFVDRKEKSITRSSIEMAYHRTLALDGIVTGPKKLGVFGASYLYPVFLSLGIAEKKIPTTDSLS